MHYLYSLYIVYTVAVLATILVILLLIDWLIDSKVYFVISTQTF